MERSQTCLRMDLVSYPENSFDFVLHFKVCNCIQIFTTLVALVI